MKTTANIEKISLWEDNPQKDRTSNVVRVDFKFPCTWTIFTVDELLLILKLWIEAEERRFPKDQGFKGRDLLYNKIKEVFEEEKK